ncbi:hypothetical protein HanXRQr2_Chr10g0418371 [Helianthus annuus]|uniref:Uncharacterized protein n=1 Tax=Helianthus annuus TaxID=4232 RepID=A0A9K3HU38_HELAN|nr:hypothetical protein HanXRQr2_Chr10g0418371 [Helianthus annuus]KAJ0882024.1 hypothetical protein HanPSC8_Chr10g0404761 [Helianthus annuus]
MDRRDFRAGGLTESSLSILWGLEVTRAYSECCILSFTFEIHEGSMRVMVKDGRDKTATLNILNGYSNRGIGVKIIFRQHSRKVSLESLAWKLEGYLTLLLHTCFKYIISCFESCELKLTLVYGLTHYQEHLHFLFNSVLRLSHIMLLSGIE